MTRVEAAAIARAVRAAKASPLKDRFWSKVDVRGEDECWPWKAAVRRKDQGYGAFWMDGRHHPANRIAMQLSGTEVTEGMHACHRCDNPSCCNPKHLFPGTDLENNQDKVFKGRQAKGQRHGRSKLSDEQVADIQKHRPPSLKNVRRGLCQEIAAKHGISAQYVSEIFAKPRSAA